MAIEWKSGFRNNLTLEILLEKDPKVIKIFKNTWIMYEKFDRVNSKYIIKYNVIALKKHLHAVVSNMCCVIRLYIGITQYP